MTISCSKLKGEFSRPITVSTNDPSNPKVTLNCKGKILEPIGLEPPRVIFGQVSRKETSPQKQTVVLTAADGGPITPKLRPITEPGFEAQLREIEPHQRYELDVSMKPPFAEQRMQAKIEVETGLAAAPVATIDASAWVMPRVQAVPQNIRIPAVMATDWETSAFLKWDDSESHRIVSATVNDPGLQVSVKEDNGNQSVLLRVPKDYQPATRGRANLIIKTDDPEHQTVVVPIMANRKSAAADDKKQRSLAAARAAAERRAARAKAASSDDSGGDESSATDAGGKSGSASDKQAGQGQAPGAKPAEGQPGTSAPGAASKTAPPKPTPGN